MRRFLNVVIAIVGAVSSIHAQQADKPIGAPLTPSIRGSAFPSSERGPAFPQSTGEVPTPKGHSAPTQPESDGSAEAFGTLNSNLNGMTWHPLRIGGGGFVTGIDFSADGSTRVVRTDTYGAYIWNDTRSQWTQLVNTSSMPASDVGIDNKGGVYEIRVAPRLPDRLYMAYQGYVYRSDDAGSHWTRTSFAKVSMNANDTFRMLGQKMAIDPANPDVVYVGTPQNGLFVTTDGGITWHSVNAIPAGLTSGNNIYPGITGIEFDPIFASGKTKAIFAASYGHGVYESTDDGLSWSAIGGPSAVQYAAVSSDGIYYVVGNGNSLWRYNGTWIQLLSEPSGSQLQSVAVDPSNPNEIVLQTEGGSLNISYNGGATWSGDNFANQFRSNDIPWLASSGVYMTIGGTIFDPLIPNKLWASDGVGVWNTTNLPTAHFQWNTPVIWDDQSVGIEQLVANQIIVPPDGRPILASWDRPVFYVGNPKVFPLNYGPDNQNAIVMGWALDYASTDPSFIVGVFNWQVEKSGYSQDGGQTWKPFATYPYPIANYKIGGSIAASTPENIVWAPSNNASPYYTKDGGKTWIPISITGVPTTGETGWGWAYYLNRHIVAADRVSEGTFYLYNYLKGLFRSSDGGSTWNLIHPGEIAPWSTYNATLKSVPDHQGQLFFTSGPQGNPGAQHPADTPFMRSIDGGLTWSAVPNVLEVRAFGFGKALHDYPTVFINGWVNRKYGIWRSDDNARSWVQVGNFPVGSLDDIKTIDGDKAVYGTIYVGFSGSGYAYGSLGE